MKKAMQKVTLLLALTAWVTIGAVGCNNSTAQNADGQQTSAEQGGNTEKKQEDDTNKDAAGNEAAEAPEIDGLTYESSLQLDYAKMFAVHYYSDDYKLIHVENSTDYLVVPEEKETPENLDENIVVLQQPLDRIYLAASAAMALFDSVEGLDHIRLSGTEASAWYVDNARKAMEDGTILFAGKYSEPDYELLLSEDCNLAVESTMIMHTPKVKEMLEDLGIPVFVDYSSYESHPLGRTEWIKLYGALIDKEDKAEAFFDEQAEVISELKDFQNTEKTVAFFYLSTDGTVVVRETTDYIPSMIEIAGGRYIFTDQIDPSSSRTSVSMTVEEFYNKTVDADYLVYNGTIDAPIETMEELLAKSELFADYKAVKEGNVWCVGKYMYQATDIVGNMIRDFHHMLTDQDESQMTFLSKVQ